MSPDRISAETSSPLSSLAKGIWWFVLLRGLFAIIFGVLALIAPVAALVGVAIVFGAYAIVDGIAEIVQAVRGRKHDSRWGWLLFQGIVSALAGLVALIAPAVVGLVGGLFILWLIVVYAVVHGILGLVSLSGAHGTRGRVWGLVSAVITLVFGLILAVVVVLSPGASVLSLIWVVGIYAVFFGIMLVVAAITIRSSARSA
jgi:uncharacterized membrane protein HdeD (DUF308 family)